MRRVKGRHCRHGVFLSVSPNQRHAEEGGDEDGDEAADVDATSRDWVHEGSGHVFVGDAGAWRRLFIDARMVVYVIMSSSGLMFYDCAAGARDRIATVAEWAAVGSSPDCPAELRPFVPAPSP